MHRWRRSPDGFPSGARQRRPDTGPGRFGASASFEQEADGRCGPDAPGTSGALGSGARGPSAARTHGGRLGSCGALSSVQGRGETLPCRGRQGQPGAGPRLASARIPPSAGDPVAGAAEPCRCLQRLLSAATQRAPLAEGFVAGAECARAGGAGDRSSGCVRTCGAVGWAVAGWGVWVWVCGCPRARVLCVGDGGPVAPPAPPRSRSGQESEATCLSSGAQRSLGGQLGGARGGGGGGCEAGARSRLAGALWPSGCWLAGRQRGEGARWGPRVPAGQRLPARRCARAPRWVAWGFRASFGSALTGATFPGWTPGPGPLKGGPCRGPASRWPGSLCPGREAGRCGQGKASSRWQILVGTSGHLSRVWREGNGGRRKGRALCGTVCSWWRECTALRARRSSPGTGLLENGMRRALGICAAGWSAGGRGSGRERERERGRKENAAPGKQVRRDVLRSSPGLRGWGWDRAGKARELVGEGVCAPSLWPGASRRQGSALGPFC